MRIGLLAAITALFLTGCCTYHGKVLSKSEAERMKALGMDIHCP